MTCTRRIQFCAGHRVLRHEGKCAHMHGHNYVALITCEPDEGPYHLDDVGRVVDFSAIKERIGGWIERNWDHGFLYFKEDVEVQRCLETLDHKRYAMPDNPTAENMALYLLHEVCPRELRGAGVTAVRIRVWETENCYADAELGE